MIAQFKLLNDDYTPSAIKTDNEANSRRRFLTISKSQQKNSATNLSKDYLDKTLGLLDNEMLDNKSKDRMLAKISLKKLYDSWAGAKKWTFPSIKLMKFQVEL